MHEQPVESKIRTSHKRGGADNGGAWPGVAGRGGLEQSEAGPGRAERGWPGMKQGGVERFAKEHVSIHKII